MSVNINLQPRKKTNLLYRYGYVLLMLICMILATIQPHIGATNGEQFSINASVKKKEIYIHKKKSCTIFILNWDNNALRCYNIVFRCRYNQR